MTTTTSTFSARLEILVVRSVFSIDGQIYFQVIPVEGNFTVNDEAQKSFEEMIPEIVISK